MTNAQPIWTETISFDEIPEGGSHIHLVADQHTRDEMAKAASLRDVSRLEASFNIMRQGNRSLRIVGDVTANIGQTCVVTLEPVESEVHENFSLLFTESAGASIADDQGQATVEFGDADTPEPMHAGTVDIAAVATEFFLLGINPYPRKEGAVFEPPPTVEDQSSHPFAALSALKKGKTGRSG
jgi:hypothetical protein